MLIHGVDSTDKIIPLLLDASGNVIVSASQLTTTGGKIHVDANGNIITSADQLTTTGGKVHIDANGNVYTVPTNPSYLDPEIGSAQLLQYNLPAGNSYQTVFTVPANQEYQLDTVAICYLGTVTGVFLYPQIYNGSLNLSFDSVVTPVSAKFYPYFPNVVMSAGWKFQVFVQGATLNDDLYANAFYRRIK